MAIAAEVKVTLETLAPVHVGSGDEAVLGIDAVALSGSIYIIDIECAATHLDLLGISASRVLETGRGFERIVETIRDGFAKLLASYDKGKLPCRPYRLKASIAKGVSLSRNVSIKLPQQTLIPASTLKGLLRTAVIYSTLDEAKDELIDMIRRSVRGITPKASRTLMAAGNPVELILRGEKPHGKGRFIFDAARLLAVSEPEPTSIRLSLYSFTRVDVAKGDRIASEYVIALTPGSRLTYRVSLLASPAAKIAGSGWVARLKDVDNLITLDRIVKGLKMVSEAVTSYELSRLKHSSLNGYKVWLNKLVENITGNCFTLRLGYGAGHVAKTVLYWVAKHAPDVVKELKDKLSRHYGHLWDDATTTIALPDGVGVGWVRLCIATSCC